MKNQAFRYQEIAMVFSQEFSQNPEFIARAPGRFDLLGGHNDYLGYPVCAAALR